MVGKNNLNRDCLRKHKTDSVSLGLTGSSAEQQRRTDVCAPRYACGSFNFSISVKFEFLFDTGSGVSRGA